MLGGINRDSFQKKHAINSLFFLTIDSTYTHTYSALH